MAHKLRFGIQTSSAATPEAWAEKARKIEELGYSSLFVPDHFSDQFAPLQALQAAAAATTSLRVGTLVLGNDYRHPVVLAKELATLDLFSGGRLEAGIGAGWMVSDYEQAGMSYDRPGVRISRLEESLAVLKRAFGEGPFSFSGKHYQVKDCNGLPKPVQQPHPPFLIGGGGRRVLSLAAREAQIVGINFSLAAGAVGPEVAKTGTAAATREKVAAIREAAGSTFDELEINTTVFVCVVTDDAQAMAERVAPGFGMQPADVLESPHVLIGSVDQIVDAIERRREEFGITYTVFSGDVHEQMAPVVARLAGR